MLYGLNGCVLTTKLIFRVALRFGVVNLLRTFLFVGLAQWAFARETNAPTGVYVSLSSMPERITIDLKTNGLYTVLAMGLNTNSQTGVWKWDEAKRQFSLTPNTNSVFPYELRVLRVDPRQSDTLQWIPLKGIGSASGAIDFVRFKRKQG